MIPVRSRCQDDAEWMARCLVRRWGSTEMVVNRTLMNLQEHPALVAGDRQGLLVYRQGADDAEILSLDAVAPGLGIGTRLVSELLSRLEVSGLHRLLVTTTNDNLAALRFFQRRGFRLSALRPGAVDEARRLKPSVPLLGKQGIPLRDEIELVLALR